MSLRLDARARQHLYSPLAAAAGTGARTIRLVEVLPGDFCALPIHCRLVERELVPELSYKALSYSWQNNNSNNEDSNDGAGCAAAAAEVAILCNGQTVHVSANLHAALRRLRAPAGHGAVAIWVDAICINQLDHAERARQVAMMRDIYRGSSEVLIWLGESGAGDDMGNWVPWAEEHAGADENPNIVRWSGDAGDIPKLKAYFSSSGGGEGEGEGEEKAAGWGGGDHCDIFGAFCVLHLLASGVPVDKLWHLRHVRYSTSIVNGLNAIMAKAWWQRIWVVQETVVAKNPVIYYGSMCAPWRMFALAAVEYDMCRLRDNLDGAFSHLKSGYSLMQLTRVIMEIESTRRSWERLEPMVPLTLLRKFRSRLATDPKDKVFAILGLIRTWGTEKSGQAIEGVAPDYTVQDRDIFFRTTELLIRNTRSLAALAGTLQSSSNPYAMPSWVTDWGCLPGVNEHIRLGNIQLYDAAEYITSSVVVHGQSILETQGYLVDKIDYVGRVLETGQGRNRARLTVIEWRDSLADLSEAHAGAYIGGGSLYTAFWRTLCSDLEFVQYADRSDYVREFRRLRDDIEENEAYERWLIADEQSNRRTSLVGGIFIEPTSSEMEMKSKNAFQYLLECASGGRRFFRTKMGYIGNGPVDMNVGDSVAVMLGSQVPFILRQDRTPRRCSGQDIRVLFSERAFYQAGKGAKVGKDETIHCFDSHQQCYRVVGDAYVHDLIRGDIKRTRQWHVEPIYLV
ncbi:heterokaryon incompatibility protein-domain-containing protein [Nemania sp. FL0916]|nr:heterokaryon incompatibility protein-domain-containing protein [Nemania sp. FL0916]